MMFNHKKYPEDDFIIELVKLSFNSGSIDHLNNLLPKCNFPLLNQKVRNQGIAAFLNKLFSEHKIPIDIPVDLRNTWKQYAAESALQNTLIEQEGLIIFNYLNQHGIEYILLKGFSYTEELYGSRWVRPIGDLDIMINKESYPKVKDFLLNIGFNYSLQDKDPDFHEKMITRIETRHNQMHFEKQLGVFKLHIDLHWDIADLIHEGAPLRNIFPINELDWFQSKSIFYINEVPIYCLNKEMHFIHLVYHFSLGHQFLGLKWFLDICLFIDKLGNLIDWNYIQNIVRESNSGKPFAVTRRLVKNILSDSNCGLLRWPKIKNVKINPVELSYFNNRLLSRQSHTGIYLSFFLLAPTFPSKIALISYLLFNKEAIPEWQSSGRKGVYFLQPFYLIYWGIKEVMTGKMNNHKQ